MYECISSFHDSEALTVVILSEQELVIQLKMGGWGVTHIIHVFLFTYLSYFILIYVMVHSYVQAFGRGLFGELAVIFPNGSSGGWRLEPSFLWALYVPVFRFIILFIFINQLLTFQNTRLLKFTPSLQCQKYEYRNVL